MRGARPQICCTFMPRPMATSLTLMMADPWAAATLAVCDCPPSNWLMLASMQRLANSPRALATDGEVCTTLGGATETPTLILRMVGQLGAPCAAAAVAAATISRAQPNVRIFDTIVPPGRSYSIFFRHQRPWRHRALEHAQERR